MDYKTLTQQTPVTLVEFYASWCPHCKRMNPVVEQIKQQLDGRAAVVQLDIDDHDELSESLDIDTVPTFLVYHNGTEQWRLSGETDARTIMAQVEKHL